MRENEADQEIERAERDAGHGQFVSDLDEGPATAPTASGQLPAATTTPSAGQHVASAPAQTQSSRFEAIKGPGGRSGSSASSSVSSVTSSHRPGRYSQSLERAETQKDLAGALERNETAMSRIHTQRSQHEGTVGGSHLSRRATRLSQQPLPEFGAGKPYPPPLPAREEYVVEFNDEHDPRHPFNWPTKRKVAIAFALGYTTLTSAFTSSIFSASIPSVSRQFGVSTEVGTLGVSLYVLGFATGPLLWGPLSELRGRRLPLLISMFGFMLFQFAVGAAKDLQTIIICRFWGGFFAAAPLAIVGAVFSDMFDNRTRGAAITLFSMTVFAGPLMAPFVGGFIVMNPNLGWPWTAYISGIMGALALILIIFFGEETYAPIILVQKAEELRRRTKNWGIHAKQEEIEIDFRELIEKNFSRPFRLLFTEPIVLLVSLYMAFIYGILYLFLTAYPLAFQQVRGFNPGVGGLPFFGMILGMLLAGCFILVTQPAYTKKLEANKNIPVPEWRLPPVIIGACSFAVGLFWFAWTGYRADIHWIAPTLSGLCTGFGLLSIFLQLLNYLIDCYLMYAASAIAANTFLRSTFGAVFPLFATYMFEALSINWGASLLGFFAVAFIPIPVLFYIFGRRIRSRSKFAPSIDLKVGPEAERLRNKGKLPDAEKQNGALGHPEGAGGMPTPSAPEAKADGKAE